MNPDGGGPAPEDPIRVLLGQELDTSSDFVGRVRGRIRRRTAASQLASFSWNLPRLVLAEMTCMLNHVFTALGGKGNSWK